METISFRDSGGQAGIKSRVRMTRHPSVSVTNRFGHEAFRSRKYDNANDKDNEEEDPDARPENKNESVQARKSIQGSIRTRGLTSQRPQRGVNPRQYSISFPSVSCGVTVGDSSDSRKLLVRCSSDARQRARPSTLEACSQDASFMAMRRPPARSTALWGSSQATSSAFTLFTEGPLPSRMRTAS